MAALWALDPVVVGSSPTASTLGAMAERFKATVC